MPRPAHRDITPDQADLIDDLADLIRHGRAIDAAHAADRATTTAALRDVADSIPGWGLSRPAVVEALAKQGINVTEGLLRKWARAGELVDPPVWWEVIDHRPPDELRAILETVLGMEVDVTCAPCVLVPVTAAQVEALRRALPGAVIGPASEIGG